VIYSHEPLPVRAADVRPTDAEKQRFAELARYTHAGFLRVERLPGNIGYLKFDFFVSPAFSAESAAAAFRFIAGTDAPAPGRQRPLQGRGQGQVPDAGGPGSVQQALPGVGWVGAAPARAERVDAPARDACGQLAAFAGRTRVRTMFSTPAPGPPANVNRMCT